MHCPTNVGNQGWCLSRAERQLGHDSDLVVAGQTWLQYKADRVLDAGSGLRPRLGRLLHGYRSAFRYDAIHYYFGQSFGFSSGAFAARKRAAPLLLSDVLLARRFGVTRFMTLQGCDVRIARNSRERNAWTMCSQGECGLYEQCIATLDQQRLEGLAEILPLMDRVFYLNPELGHEVTKGDFLPYANADLSVDPVWTRKTERPVVVHAPTDDGIKGTRQITGAMNQASSTHDFSFEVVKGMPHARAMEIYARADIAIDQVLSGWYGGFAVEMMSLGKPVACYLRDEDFQFLPEAMRAELPLFNLRPWRLAEDIDHMFSERSTWADRGRQGRKYVERWHDPLMIAKALMPLYKDPSARLALMPLREPQ